MLDYFITNNKFAIGVSYTMVPLKKKKKKKKKKNQKTLILTF